MQVHPELAKLRSGDVPQPSCDAALAAWRGLPDVAAVLAAVARYDAGEQLDDLPALARIASDHAAALGFVAGLITLLIAALQAEPLAQLSMGHSAAPGMARLRLAGHARAGLTLVAFARRARVASPSALFEDCAVHEIVVAGEGRALLHRLNDTSLTTGETALAPGMRLTRDGADAARQIIAVTRPLLMLQITREAARPQASREISLDDGRLIKSISGCKRSSQQVMALGVLGALAHRPALGEMERLARDGEAERDLRWEALRQLLALDAGRGLSALALLADRPEDSLAASAATLRRNLIAAHPDLAPLMPEPA